MVHGTSARCGVRRPPTTTTFAELGGSGEDLPIYLPWPMSPGWSISDFGCVTAGDRAYATVTTTVGTSDLDGPVEVTVVAEDPGSGWVPAAPVRRTTTRATRSVSASTRSRSAPGAARSRCGSSTPRIGDALATSVFAGEADGRWLWLVVRPASAALLLRDEWLLADVTGFGPEALEMPFGGLDRPGDGRSRRRDGGCPR